MNTAEQVQEQYRTDPFIELWKNNYNTNLSEGLLASAKARPLVFLANSLPYSNIPIVLVVAGPSIDKNIGYLKEYKDKCIIICADVVLFKLLEHGIKPDFVINVDPHESIIRFWKSLDTSDLILICPTTTNPITIQYWKGKIFFYNQVDIEGSSKGEALKKLIKPTKNWGSVFNRFFIGATMFQIATIFKPLSIILVGYDFGFTDEKAYCYCSTYQGKNFWSGARSFSSNETQTYHTSIASGLENGETYDFFVRCVDLAGNTNSGDILIRFQIAS